MKGYEKGEEIQTSTLLENIAAYVSLIRHHMHREEYVFYPMAEKEFSEDEYTSLMEEFSKESEKAGGKTVENSKNLIQKMGSILVK